MVAYCRRAAASGPSAWTASAAPCCSTEQFSRRPEITSLRPLPARGARAPAAAAPWPRARPCGATPASARWMLEKHGSRERFADGSVLVEIPYASEEWLVKELLKYQGEAGALRAGRAAADGRRPRRGGPRRVRRGPPRAAAAAGAPPPAEAAPPPPRRRPPGRRRGGAPRRRLPDPGRGGPGAAGDARRPVRPSRPDRPGGGGHAGPGHLGPVRRPARRLVRRLPRHVHEPGRRSRTSPACSSTRAPPRASAATSRSPSRCWRPATSASAGS